MTTATPKTSVDPFDDAAAALDRSAAATTAQLTSGLSPATLLLAATDWAAHLLGAPGKQLQLNAKMLRKQLRLLDYAGCSARDPDAKPAIEPLPQDGRFSDPAWSQPPFNFIAQSFLLNQQWWHAATTGVGGVSRHHEEVVEFAARQLLDLFAPTNFVATNPVLQRKIADTGGQCLVDGFTCFIEDLATPAARRAARGRGGFQGRGDGGHGPGQGRLPQSADRIDPVRADHRERPPGTRADRAGVDHEILHPGPFAGELAGPLADRPGLYGLHDLLAQSRERRPRSRPRRLPPARAAGRPGCDRGHYGRGQGACRGILPGRHAPVGHRRGDGARWRRPPRQRHPARRADRIQRAGRTRPVHRRVPAQRPAEHDVEPRLPRQPPDGRRLPAPEVQRPRLVPRAADLPDGRTRADERPNGLERRWNAHAVRNAQRVPDPLLPPRRSRQGQVQGRRADRHPVLPPRAAVRGRHGARPRRSVDVRAQDPPADRR